MPACLSEIEVQDDYIGLFPAGQGDSLLTISRFAHDDNAMVTFQKHPQSFTHDCLIINQQYSDVVIVGAWSHLHKNLGQGYDYRLVWR